MRVMVFMKATGETESGVLPPTEALEAMDRFTEELVKAGVFVAGAGLKPTVHAKRVAIDGANRAVIDGPFTETKEVIAGFSIWEVKDMEDAVAWALRCPNPMSAPSEIEIRPFFEFADLAQVLPPDPEGAAPRDATRQKLGVA